MRDKTQGWQGQGKNQWKRCLWIWAGIGQSVNRWTLGDSLARGKRGMNRDAEKRKPVFKEHLVCGKKMLEAFIHIISLNPPIIIRERCYYPHVHR